MDPFTQRALAVSRSSSAPEFAEAEKSPITIEDRLAFAYPGGVPKAVARMIINWDLPYGRDSYQTQQNAMAIYRGFEARALAADQRSKENRDRIPELERSLATLRAEYAGLRAQLERPPALHLTPREVGLIEVDRAGYEKLIPAMEAEIERLRQEIGRATREYDALWPLAQLAGVIAGHLSRGAVTPSKFGFEYDWQICAPSLRKEREAAHRAELERKRIEAAQWEAGQAERERQAAERAEAERAQASRDARIDAFGFEGLMSFLFFEERDLTLDEIKRQVAGWGHYHTLKAAVRLWPERPEPDLWTNVRREIVEIANGRGKLFQRAADRLAQILHPGYFNAAATLNQAAQDLHEAEERQPTYHEIEALDFDGLLKFIFRGKSKTLDDLPTLKAVIAGSPARPAANVLTAATNELHALGRTESALYNHALRRLSSLVDARLNPPWEETKSL